MNKFNQVLKHLESSTIHQSAWDVPFSLCESGIVESLGGKQESRSYMNRILNQLQDEGLIFFVKKHIIGGTGTRRRKAYFITEEGKEKLLEVQTDE